MSSVDDARAHLAKAREFLEAAQLSHDLDLHNAAAANAVTSAVNSKDAICLRLTGRTGKGDNHDEARAELRAAGPAGRALEPTFGRLLRLKTKAQYQAGQISPSDATKSIEWAARMLDAATEITSS